ncbi:MAG TPA: tripartite tricarboxylate transporter TctB family protein [Candidatus Binatia bacterium]|nr:tripartite tricarboxylate transporter TctB family protein [Candidatus Binatia bacterium]
MHWIKFERPLFTLLIGIVLAVAIQISLEWPVRASIIILVLGAIGSALIIYQFASDIKSAISGKASEALTMEAPIVATDNRWGNLEIWSWILGFFVAIHLIGFLAAVPVFIFSYTKTYGGGWLLSAALGAAGGGFVYLLFNVLLHVPWPEPLIASLLS